MTEQIADTCTWREKTYTVLGGQGKGYFSPKSYGFNPSEMGTACYAGYFCGFSVADGQFLLDRLTINSMPSKDPFFALKSPQEVDEFGSAALSFKQLNLPVPFSGVLRLIISHSINSYQDFKQQEVHDLQFANGKFVVSWDRTAEAAAMEVEARYSLDAIDWRIRRTCACCQSHVETALIGGSKYLAGHVNLAPRTVVGEGREHRSKLNNKRFVEMCSECGYCAFELEADLCPDPAFVTSNAYLALLNEATVPQVARELLCAALFHAIRQDHLTAFKASLTAAWVADEAGAEDGARVCRKQALQHLASLLKSGTGLDASSGTVTAIIQAELLRRIGNFHEAEWAAERGLSMHPDLQATQELSYIAQLVLDKQASPRSMKQIPPEFTILSKPWNDGEIVRNAENFKTEELERLARIAAATNARLEIVRRVIGGTATTKEEQQYVGSPWAFVVSCSELANAGKPLSHELIKLPSSVASMFAQHARDYKWPNLDWPSWLVRALLERLPTLAEAAGPALLQLIEGHHFAAANFYLKDALEGSTELKWVWKYGIGKGNPPTFREL